MRGAMGRKAAYVPRLAYGINSLSGNHLHKKGLPQREPIDAK